MADEPRTVGGVAFQLLLREKAAISEHGVECLDGVPLAHDEAVAFRIVELVGRDVHRVVVKRHEDVRHTEVAADVACSCMMDHLDDVLADVDGFLLEIHVIPP